MDALQNTVILHLTLHKFKCTTKKPPSLSRIYMLIILLNKPRLDDELLLFIRETVTIRYLLCLAILFIPALVYVQLFFTLGISDDPFLSNCNLYVG